MFACYIILNSFFKHFSFLTLKTTFAKIFKETIQDDMKRSKQQSSIIIPEQ